MIGLLYIEPKGRELTQVGDAIGLHLNYLATGKDATDLQDVERISVEGADETAVPPSVYDEFVILSNKNKQLAGQIRERFLRYRIIFNLTSGAYNLIGEKIYVFGSKDVKIKENKKTFEIQRIMTENEQERYKAIVKDNLNSEEWIEKMAKTVFEQVASPQLNDLALSQAEIKATMATMATKDALDAMPDAVADAMARRFPILRGDAGGQKL
jgi:hypothetical protein